LLEPSKLVVLQWSSEDVADLHRRVRRIERLGPTAESPPDAIGDYVQDVELLVTHMCPVDAELIRQSPKLSMIGVCRAGTENVDRHESEARGGRGRHRWKSSKITQTGAMERLQISHSQNFHQEGEFVGRFGDNLVRWLAGSVSGPRFNANQDRGLATLGRL